MKLASTNKKWSCVFRLWHWVHALVIFGLLATVFLRDTFLNKGSMRDILSEKLSQIDIHIMSEQATVLAKAIRAPMWEWHIILGFALSVLLILRVILFFTSSGKINFTNFKLKTLHKRIVSLSYIGFYLLILIMIISGFSIYFGEDLNFSKSMIDKIEDIHETVFYLILIFSIVHILGVILAENQNEKGIISDMVNGGDIISDIKK